MKLKKKIATLLLAVMVFTQVKPQSNLVGNFLNNSKYLAESLFDGTAGVAKVLGISGCCSVGLFLLSGYALGLTSNYENNEEILHFLYGRNASHTPAQVNLDKDALQTTRQGLLKWRLACGLGLVLGVAGTCYSVFKNK